MKTKTLLAFLSAVFACALPATLAAAAAGLTLPPALDSLHVLSAFVAAVVLLTVCKDYTHSRACFVSSTRTIAPAAPDLREKATHPLAA